MLLLPTSPLCEQLVDARHHWFQCRHRYGLLLEEQRTSTDANPSLLAAIRRAAEDDRMARGKAEQLFEEIKRSAKEGAPSAYALALQCAVIDRDLVQMAVGNASVLSSKSGRQPTTSAAVPMPSSSSSNEYGTTTSTGATATFADILQVEGAHIFADELSPSLQPLLDFHRFLKHHFLSRLLARPTGDTVRFLLTVAHHLLHGVRDFNALAAVAAAFSSFPAQCLLRAKRFVYDLNARDRSAIESLVTMFSSHHDYSAFWKEWKSQLTGTRSFMEWKQRQRYRSPPKRSTDADDNNPFVIPTAVSAASPTVFAIYAIPFVDPVLARVRSIRDQFHNGDSSVLFSDGLSTPGQSNFAELLSTMNWAFHVDDLPVELTHATVKELANDKAAVSRFCANLQDVRNHPRLRHFILTRVYLTRKQLLEWAKSIGMVHDSDHVPSEWLVDSDDESDGSEDEGQGGTSTSHPRVEPHSPDKPPPYSAAVEDTQDMSDIYDSVFG